MNLSKLKAKMQRKVPPGFHVSFMWDRPNFTDVLVVSRMETDVDKKVSVRIPLVTYGANISAVVDDALARLKKFGGDIP